MDPLQHVQAAVALLQEQIQGLTLSDVSALQNQVNAQGQQVAALAAVPPVQAPPSVSLKPPKPDSYSSVKSSGRPETWAFTVDTYFEAARISDPDRVTYVATLLRGPAAVWWQSHVTTASTLTRITTWEAFKVAFLLQFAPIGNVRHARDRLANCIQAKSVAQYTTEFRMLVLQIPNISPDEQLDRFLRGLKPAMRREVEMREPLDLQTAMNLADRADTLMYRNPASVARPAAASGPVPMDIGAVSSGYKPALARLTPQERERLIKEGRCFKCRQKGHSWANCRPGNSRR